MKQLSIYLCFISVILASLYISACNTHNSQNDPAGYFKTKEDSIRFAKDVFRKYPGEQPPSVAVFENKADSLISANILKTPSEPVPFSYIEQCAKYYDRHPVIRDVRGFMLDANETELIKRNPNYRQIYFRLGKRSDNPGIIDYTVMVIPLGSRGEVLAKGAASSRVGENSNYDELDPCPSVCPTDWDK